MARRASREDAEKRRVLQMTLFETIRAIEAAASRQPSVNMIVRNDVFRLNAAPAARYGVFAWTQQQHVLTDDLMTFAFSLFYVDRLTEDKRNELEIQSVGVATLGRDPAVGGRRRVPHRGDHLQHLQPAVRGRVRGRLVQRAPPGVRRVDLPGRRGGHRKAVPGDRAEDSMACRLGHQRRVQ